MGMGNIGHIGLAKETTWGTPVAITDYVEAMSESMALTIERFDIKQIAALYTEADDMSGIRRIEGDVSFPVFPDIINPFLRGVFGEPTVTVTLSGYLYQNQFVTPSADFASGVPAAPYTFEIFRDVTSSFRYSGTVINGLSFQVQPNQELRATASLISKTSSVVAKTSPSFVSSPVEPFAFDTCSLSIGGAGTVVIESLTINVQQQLEGIAALNATTDIAKIRRSGPQMVEISGTADFDNLTEYNKFINQTEQALSAHFFRASSFGMTITVPRMIYTAYPVSMGGRDRLTVDFSGKGRYHTGSATAIDFTVYNASSGY